MRRLVLVATATIALTVPAGIAALATAPVAGAAGSSVSCAKLSGSSTGNVTISTCTPAGGKGYKSAGGPASALATGGTITWTKSGATTTIGNTAVTPVTPNACGKKGTEFEFTGSVTAASTTGPGIPKVGDAVRADACLTSKGTVKLVDGTSINL